MSLWLSVAAAFLLPAACALRSRVNPPELTPAEMTGAETAVIFMSLATSLVVALAIYLARRYVVLENGKTDRAWDTFTLFFFLALVGSALAHTVPMPGR